MRDRWRGWSDRQRRWVLTAAGYAGAGLLVAAIYLTR